MLIAIDIIKLIPVRRLQQR